MKTRSLLLATVAVVAVSACDSGDAELSTSSTILTDPSVTVAPSTSAPTESDGNGSESPDTSLVGQPVGSAYQVLERIPNDDGEAQIIVIPEGAYTDIDLENFVLDLLEANSVLYGAEVFTDAAAAEAFAVPEADRTEEQQRLVDENHLVTLIGRDFIEFNGPMSEFPGGAIGS